jgi:Zn-dependent protease
MGRVTLNPIPHIDPIGALVFVIARFGWGKPVLINPLNFKDPKRGELLVSAAGPASNILAALVIGIVHRVVSPLAAGGPLWIEIAVTMLYLTVWINLALAAFNMIPIHPLDGSKVLKGLLPLRQAYAFSTYERVGPIVLLGLILVGRMSGFSPIWAVIGPFVSGFSRLFAGA